MWHYYSWEDTDKHLYTPDREPVTDQSKDTPKSNLVSQWALLGFLTGVWWGVTWRSRDDWKIAASLEAHLRVGDSFSHESRKPGVPCTTCGQLSGSLSVSQQSFRLTYVEGPVAEWVWSVLGLWSCWVTSWVKKLPWQRECFTPLRTSCVLTSVSPRWKVLSWRELLNNKDHSPQSFTERQDGKETKLV